MINKNKSVNQLLGDPTLLYEKFHSKTKIYTFEPKSKKPPIEKKYLKGYGRYKSLQLPKPYLPEVTLIEVLERRKSSRTFVKVKLTIGEISSLLYYSAGLKIDQKHRFYPSGGALYPLEVYVIGVNSHLSGLYHYYLHGHLLEKIPVKDIASWPKSFNQKWLKEAGIIVLITAVFERLTNKYGTRGYRHILEEAGHLGQNIYLNSEALRLGCRAIGGYKDDELNSLIGVDGLKESIIYAFAVGKVRGG